MRKYDACLTKGEWRLGKKIVKMNGKVSVKKDEPKKAPKASKKKTMRGYGSY